MDFEDLKIIFIVIPTLLGFASLLMLPKMVKMGLNKFKALGDYLFAEYKCELQSSGKTLFGITTNNYLSVEAFEHEFEVRKFAGSKNSPARNIFLVKMNQPYAMTITKESMLHSLGKKIGVAKELTIGQRELDDHYFIISDDKTIDTPALTSSAVIEVLTKLKSEKNFERLQFIPAPSSSSSFTAKSAPGKLQAQHGWPTTPGIYLSRYHTLYETPECREESKQVLKLLADMADKLN